MKDRFVKVLQHPPYLPEWGFLWLFFISITENPSNASWKRSVNVGDIKIVSFIVHICLAKYRFSLDTFWIYIWRLSEKFIGWPRYSHRMWPSEGYFVTYFLLWCTHSFHWCCSAWIPLIKKVINSRYDVCIQIFLPTLLHMKRDKGIIKKWLLFSNTPNQWTIIIFRFLINSLDKI